MRHLQIALLLVVTVMSGALANSAQAQKIGVVDLQRALNETEDGRQAKAKLKELFDQRQKALNKQQNDIRTMKQGLEKQRDVLSRDVLAKKAQGVQKAFAQLQTNYMEFQRELAAKEAELTQHIIARMERIVRRIGQKDGYTMILDRSSAGVVYVPSTYDLTDVVIQRYNARDWEDKGSSGKNAGKGKSKGTKGERQAKKK